MTMPPSIRALQTVKNNLLTASAPYFNPISSAVSKYAAPVFHSIKNCPRVRRVSDSAQRNWKAVVAIGLLAVSLGKLGIFLYHRRAAGSTPPATPSVDPYAPPPEPLVPSTSLEPLEPLTPPTLVPPAPLTPQPAPIRTPAPRSAATDSTDSIDSTWDEVDPLAPEPLTPKQTAPRSAAENSDWDIIDDNDIRRAPAAPLPVPPTKGMKYSVALKATKDALEASGNPPDRTISELRSLLRAPGLDPDVSQCAEQILTALNALNEFEQSNEDIRVSYAKFIIASRQALLSAKKLPPKQLAQLKTAIDYLKNVHYLKYTGVAMYPFYQRFIGEALASTGRFVMPEQWTLGNITETLRRANGSLERACLEPQFLQGFAEMNLKKFWGTLGTKFDPSGGSNVQYLHSLQEVVINGKQKTILTLRHGTPTIDPNFLGFLYREGVNAMRGVANWVPRVRGLIPSAKGLTTVTPEYEATLEANPENQVLYVSNQEHRSEKYAAEAMHGERSRNKALQELESKHPNFHFAALPMELDEPIWKAPIAQLKETLLHSFIRSEHGFDLPAKLNRGGLEARIKTLLNQVHELYFDNRELNDKERTAFIMIFYSYVTNVLKSELNIDRVTVACKDDKDRGNASKLATMMIHLMVLGQENDPERLQEVALTALGPFLIKNEKIIRGRLEMALSVFDVISRLDEDHKRTIRDSFQKMAGLQLVAQSVPKNGPTTIGPAISVNLDPADMKHLTNEFRQNGVWDLPKLRAAIKGNNQISIELNGVFNPTFEQICESLELRGMDFNKPVSEKDMSLKTLAALPFLTTLRPAIFEKVTAQIFGRYGNHKTLQLQQERRSPPTIKATYNTKTGQYSLHAKTEQVLTNEASRRAAVAEAEQQPVSIPVWGIVQGARKL